MGMIHTCKECGARIGAKAPFGHCPKCLIALGFVSDPEELEAGNPSGRELGDYELLDQIGRGGMGVVYRARQISLKREVALKMVLPGKDTNPSAIKRFEIEAEAAAKLQHPNIVPIYETGREVGQHFFTMQLIEGENLHQCHNRIRLPDASAISNKAEARSAQARIVQLLSKIASAVHYAHEQGVLHRDLKPSNILISRSGEPYLTDFGLAKVFDRAESVTSHTAIMGTLSYMSPEQAAGRRISKAADIFSLGIILYELLTDRKPFTGATPAEALRHLAEQDPLDPTVHNRWIDKDLATICLKCLQKRPEERYGTAGDLAEDLGRWTRCEPVQARPLSRTVRMSRWVQRNRMATALMLTLVLGLSTSLFFHSISVRERRSRKDAVAALIAALGDVLSQLRWDKGYVELASETIPPMAGKEISIASGDALTMNLGVPVYRNHLVSLRSYSYLVNYLEQSIGSELKKHTRLNLQIFSDITTENLKSSQVSFIRMPWLDFIEARREGVNLKPVVRAKNSQLRCRIISLAKPGAEQLPSLKGATIYFGERRSVVTLAAKAWLVEQGLTRTNFASCDYLETQEAGEYAQGGYASPRSEALHRALDNPGSFAVVLERQLTESQHQTKFRTICNFQCPDSFWVATTKVTPGQLQAFKRTMTALNDRGVFSSLPDLPVRPGSFVETDASEYEELEYLFELAHIFDNYDVKPISADFPVEPGMQSEVTHEN